MCYWPDLAGCAGGSEAVANVFAGYSYVAPSVVLQQTFVQSPSNDLTLSAHDQQLLFRPNPDKRPSPSNILGCKLSVGLPYIMFVVEENFNITTHKSSNLWWMPSSVSRGFSPAMRMSSSAQIQMIPDNPTHTWVSSQLPLKMAYAGWSKSIVKESDLKLTAVVGYHRNHLDEPILMVVPKPFLT